MTTYAEFDRSQRPLISIHFTGAKATPENFDAYLEELNRNYAPKEPFALIFELSKAPVPGPSYQLKQASWMKEHEGLIEQYCLGTAYVIPSTVMRGVLKFIFGIQGQPAPFKVVTTYEEGREWAKSMVDRSSDNETSK